MDRHEEAVMEYIAGSTQRFVNPQFSIPYKDGRGGSDPDFVVVDLKDKTVYVVEVTIASNTNTLLERVQERQTRWIDPIKEHFQEINQDMGKWEYRVTLFVRKSSCQILKEKLAGCANVSVFSIESVSFPYTWAWQGKEPNNPLK